MGKSTLLRVLAGFHRPRVGSLRWNGEPVDRDRPAHRQRLRYIGDQPALLTELTVLDNWQLYSSLFGLDEVGESPLVRNLPDHKRVTDLSHGQKKRVQLATLRGDRPALLLMDEPMLALDEGGREEVRRRVGILQDGGTLVVTASPSAEPAADRHRTLEEPT